MERAYIVAAVDACHGVGTRAAELLRMNYRSFRHYSKKYNIT
jgi:DNA-binding NtrC family response regulator